jgi:hypothetical protein
MLSSSTPVESRRDSVWKRSLLYALLADGSIRGVSLRRRGQLRGKRLFDVESVRLLLRAQMQGGGK